VAEAIRIHRKVSRREARKQAGDMLELVAIPDPIRRLDDYPHQLSGGMRQRVMIAMGLACRPSLLVADEPTTALDVTIQAEILDLLVRLKEEFHLSLILISHNLGVIAEMADRVAVMYAGRIVEEAAVRDLFASPKHPYTAGLLRSVPRLGEGGAGPGRGRRRLEAIEGNVPNLLRLPPGCAFHPRCPDVMAECREAEPRLLALGGGVPGRAVACYKHHDREGRAR